MVDSCGHAVVAGEASEIEVSDVVVRRVIINVSDAWASARGLVQLELRSREGDGFSFISEDFKSRARSWKVSGEEGDGRPGLSCEGNPLLGMKISSYRSFYVVSRKVMRSSVV